MLFGKCADASRRQTVADVHQCCQGASGNDTIRDIQTQSLAIGDGIDYEKYVKNPVLDAAELPCGGSKFDFRDPKIWRNADGTYSCIAGNCLADGDGRILLFTSKDGFQWKFRSILVSNDHRFGKMWECPDFFRLDGKWVLLASPQDMLPQGFEYHNGNGTLCLIGTYDEQAERSMRRAINPLIMVLTSMHLRLC